MRIPLKLAVIYLVIIFPWAMAAEPEESSAEEQRVDEGKRSKVLLELGAFLGIPHEGDNALIGDEPSLQELRVSWLKAYQAGKFDLAVKQSLQEARHHLYLDDAKLLASLRNLGMAYQALGNYKLAMRGLELGMALAEAIGDSRELVTIKALLGSIYTFTRKANLAEGYLRDSLDMAQNQEFVEVEAMLWNDLGVVLGAQAKGLQRKGRQLEDQRYHRKARRTHEAAMAKFGTALHAYSQGYELAKEIHNQVLAVKAMVNAAELSVQFNQEEDCGRFLAIAATDIETLAPTHEIGFLFINLGQISEQLISVSGKEPAKERLEMLTRNAYTSYHRAREIGKTIGDQRLLCYAHGYIGGLYESQGRYREAISLTRKAVFIAQQFQFRDLLYLWQWQIARSLESLDEMDSAISAYERAVQTLETIRHDVAISFGNRNTQSSFREEAGRVYEELADLLLRQLAGKKSASAYAQDVLEQTCQVLERLKSAELEDYFQDDCVNLAGKKVQTMGPMSAINTAAVYIVPLADRTEIIVKFMGAHPDDVTPLFIRETAWISEADLTKGIREFRLQLEDRTKPNGYLNSAQELYRTLIQPMEDALDARGIDTLVFIPDKALRTIPITALHNGDEFLIERYAVAFSPGMSLVDLSAGQRRSPRLLLGGISHAVQDFRKLKYVPEELAGIRALYPLQNTKLENETFSLHILQREFQDRTYGTLHMATHGQVRGDVRDSFLLTYDGKLTLDGLEQLIRSNRMRGKEVDMLVLSACETAAGDERAALGLGGIAVKAGVNAAIATLWSVDDRITAELMISFYRSLKKSPLISKAKAMQKAQRVLLDHEIKHYHHPSYWAPYLVIGNWL